MNVKILFFKIVCLWILFGCHSSEVGMEKLGQSNAVWTESIYFRGYQPTSKERLTEEKIRNLAKTLKQNKILYTYIFAGPYDDFGNLPAYAFSDTAVNTVRLLNKYYPELNILPWIGGVQNETVHLEDSIWVKNAIEQTKNLIAILNVPGIHMDLEYILTEDKFFNSFGSSKEYINQENYGEYVNMFHKRLRDTLPDAFISSVVVPDLPNTKPWKRKTTSDELNVLVQYIDQLSFLYFDTQINDRKEFETNCGVLIQEIDGLHDIKKIQYLISIGTFINEPQLHKYRNMDIENIPNTLKTIKDQLAQINPDRSIISGISIYCDWETDDEEWKEIYDNWAKY